MSEQSKEFVTWSEATGAVCEIAEEVVSEHEIDRVVGISRGGLAMAVMLSHDLGAPLSVARASHYDDEDRKDSVIVQDSGVTDIEVGETVLLVDDLVDTGRTMAEIERIWSDYTHMFDYVTAVWHEKPDSAITPDISVAQTDEWIVYPWESPEQAASK